MRNNPFVHTILLGICAIIFTSVPTLAAVPIGWLDVATHDWLAGWASDPDYSGPIDVAVFIQYNGQGALQFLTHGHADLYRSGVGNHSFSISWRSSPGYHSPMGSNHKIYVYAINVDANGNPVGSGNSQLSGAPKTVSYQPPATNTGVYVHDANIEPYCPDKPVKVDLWVNHIGQWEFHNRCYTNTGADDSFPFGTFCPFKYSLPVGTNKSNIIVRSWKMNSSCSQYMDQIDPNNTSSYRDFQPAGNVLADGAFRGYGRSVQMERDDYLVKVDRNGGAVYELYNKRGSDPNLAAGHYENAIHANFGAALQVAIHSGSVNSLTSDPCGGQGYWNPTQAGASCSHDSSKALSPIAGTDLTVKCDGTVNNSCTSANSNVLHTWHKMMNWDYGSAYTGPYNALDTSKIWQNATAHDHYVEFDVYLKNTGTNRRSAVAFPTFYFTNRYRKLYYPNSFGNVTSVTVPLNATGDDANKYLKEISGYDLEWITVENTSLSVSGNYVTIAWFYDSDFLADRNSWLAQIIEGDYYDTIIFTNAPRLTYRTGVTYNLRYVIFPYKYNETVTTNFGTMTVRDTIDAMRNAY